MEIISDNDLLIRIKADDEKAFQKLFKRYYSRLYYYSFSFVKTKEIAEEAVMDIFFAIWEKRKALLISNFAFYIYASVKYKSLEYKKKKKVIFDELETVSNNSSINEHDPEQKMIFAEFENRIDSLVNQLPPQRKLVFMLNRVDGLKYKEISQLLEISLRTVEKHMYDAVFQLKDLLSKEVK